MQKVQLKSLDNTEFNFEIEENKGQVLSNGKFFEWDMLQLKEGSYHILKNNKSYKVEVLKFNKEDKTFLMEINGNRYEMNLKDKFDILLKKMGLENMASTKVSNVKSPMPGKILSIDVEVGYEVQKGDKLIILEAMKMENVIKSPADGKIKKINIKEGDSVEKNYILIDFE